MELNQSDENLSNENLDFKNLSKQTSVESSEVKICFLNQNLFRNNFKIL